MRRIGGYSGGHTSALGAIEVACRYGAKNCVLLNHDIPERVEDTDIKRFKRQVAEFIGVPITFANHSNPHFDQFDVCVSAKAFKVGRGTELCTHRLKTEPFDRWLDANSPPGRDVIYYGFDANEMHRVQRRSSILSSRGYRSDYPLALWAPSTRVLVATEDIGIHRPGSYGVFKHGNCIGCLKAGWQHWYVVYCTRPDIWVKAKESEETIGYSIHSDEYLVDMEPRFNEMRAAGVLPTERSPPQKFWADARRVIKIHEVSEGEKPCECST